MRILVTGSRNWVSHKAVRMALSWWFHANHADRTTIVHGGAIGADSSADSWARDYGYKVEVYLPKDYRSSPKPAALARTDAMLDSLDPATDLVLAFMLGTPVKGGTKYTVDGAKARGLRVIIYNWPGDPEYKG